MANDVISDTGAVPYEHSTIVAPGRAVMWSAIVAGMLAALGVQLILTLVGMGIGAAVADPYRRGSADEAIGVGAAVWLIATGVVSFGIGGYIAGLKAGVLSWHGWMHGVLSWALAAVFGATVTAVAGSASLGGAAFGLGAWADTTQPRSIGASDGSLGANAARPTDAEMREAAAAASRVLSRVALLTGAAFFASMVSAGICGHFGHRMAGHIPATSGTMGRRLKVT